LSHSSDNSNKWANYVKGTILQYLPDLQDDETFALDIAFAGDVPLGSGLSSSASLEVTTAVFLESILNQYGVAYSSYKTRNDNAALEMSSKDVKLERAIRCQRAENTFVGVPCGIMDQFVSSAGSRGNLLLIDCRSLDFREVSVGALGADEAEIPVLVIANSNVKHDLGGGEYPIRVQQCKEATETLSRVNPRIQSLRDASLDDIDTAISSESLEGVLLKRARHVVSENARTVEAADAWTRGDWAVVGELMNASHSSMKTDYEVSCEEIDVLVDLAQKFDGVYGSRLTGGGFGGCTVTLVKKQYARDLIDHLNLEYEKKTGQKCSCFETFPGNGAMAIIV
jgi:galactokinase